MVAFKNVEEYFMSKGSSQKNIKILEEEQQQIISNQATSLSPATPSHPKDRSKKMILERLIQTKRDQQQKLSARGRSQNPHDADDADSGLPILKVN